MEQDVDRNRADLEKLEDAFLIQLQTDYKQARFNFIRSSNDLLKSRI